MMCDVKFEVNDVASDGNIAKSEALVKVYKGKSESHTFKISDCDGSEEDGWWHVLTVNSLTSTVKWDCKSGGESLLQLSPQFGQKMDIDFETYVGPFPGRFWRHSRKHSRRKNTTKTSSATSFLQAPKGAEASPKKLKV